MCMELVFYADMVRYVDQLNMTVLLISYMQNRNRCWLLFRESSGYKEKMQEHIMNIQAHYEWLDGDGLKHKS